MMKKLFTPLLLCVALIGAVSLVAAPQLLAIDPSAGIQEGISASGGGSGGGNELEGGIKSIVNVLLYVLGAIAVIVIIIGGVRFTVSGGDSNSVTGARNMILYAVVGLVIALLAYAIVNFVLDAF